MDPEKALKNRVILMNGFTQPEILQIMRTVKSMYEDPQNLIFATTTKNNLNFTLRDLIQDLSEDHEYLRNNPPNEARKSSTDEGSSKDD
jgi:hypothetical protein